MTGNKKIIIFTNSYPYGNGETFFQEELKYLSQSGFHIIIQPLVGAGVARSVPEGVHVEKPIFTSINYISLFKMGFFNLAPLGHFYKIFQKGFVSNVGQYLIARAGYSNVTLKRLLLGSSIKYFYWGKGLANACVFFPIGGRKVVRLHGYDLYGNDLRPGNVIPLRLSLMQSVDSFVFISEHGRNYFRKSFGGDGDVFRLGVSSGGENPTSSDGVFTIMSCSGLVPVKRVHLIAEALRFVKSRIRWIHIGDGPERALLEELKRRLEDNIEVKFLGHKSNDDVLNFYANNHIDYLINVSESEGLPVTMMEALSFGVPIIATNVGGVSEIVNDHSGVLLPRDISPEDLGRTLTMLGNSLNAEYLSLRLSAKSEFEAKYSAKKNYQEFITFLRS